MSNKKRLFGLWIHLIKIVTLCCSPLLTSFSFLVTMVMGIPTVKRKVKSYLSETLRSLIDKLSPEEKLDCVIIVFVGEVRSHKSYNMSHRKRLLLKSKCLNSVFISADWRGVRSQRSRRSGERVRKLLCFPTIQKKMEILWMGVKVTILSPQVRHRAEFRLARGDFPSGRLLPRPRQPQRDFWRLQRESQVSSTLNVCVISVFTADR